MNRYQAIRFLTTTPYKFGHLVGFNKLTPLHNEWIMSMIYGKDDETLQAHRGSYKTTCVSVALAIIIILFPNDKTIFFRKTDTDVQEIVAQVKKILKSDVTQYFVNTIWRTDLQITTERIDAVNTNLAANDPRGTPQLLAMGTKGSVTGKHFDRVFTDDIINKDDRVSKAEREKTKAFYMELQNVKNRGGRIYNTGTPWHKDDAFELMPNPKVYDCYTTGLISAEQIEQIRAKMTASLFAANYELRHIASDDVIFTNPQTGADISNVYNGECHIDAAYGGEDYTAFTVVKKTNGKYYVLGKLRHKHIDDCEDEFIMIKDSVRAGKINVEDNGDKGYLAKNLRRKGCVVHQYHENMNKFVKITSYLKAEWENVIFVEGTDREYIEQVIDYTIDAEHDDAPDSLACMIRKLWNRKEKPDDGNYLMYL